MRKFLWFSSLFIFPLILGVFGFSFLADGYSDPFYLRFTTPRQNSLILGTSRAAQGIQPGILNQILHRDDFFNYSFTISHSPFGPVYLNSIKKKLHQGTLNGIFIVTVDPWSISSTTENPEDQKKFRETNLSLAKTKFVNLNPNIYYLLSNSEKPLFELIFRKDSAMFLHNDGWLEVNVSMDSSSVATRIDSKVNEYITNNLPKYQFSKIRLKYLVETVSHLENHGKVFLVRLPVHPLISEIDNKLIPDFNQKMTHISAELGVSYLDMSFLNGDLLYTDGNHLHKTSGEFVSAYIGNWIINQENF